MAKATAADNLCERLVTWGVNTVYGFPGDGINGILGALRRHQDALRFVQTRHEEMASFMACGHAKFTGQVGVCMATSGPGAIHLLNGLYDAKLDHQPAVAVVGQTFVRAMGGDFQQEVNLTQLYSDAASSWCQQVNTPSSVRHIVDRAFRIAHRGTRHERQSVTARWRSSSSWPRVTVRNEERRERGKEPHCLSGSIGPQKNMTSACKKAQARPSRRSGPSTVLPASKTLSAAWGVWPPSDSPGRDRAA